MATSLLNEHAVDLAKKLPSLFRRRTAVLLVLFAMHLFVVTRFVQLSEEEQLYRQEVDLTQKRIEKLQEMQSDIGEAQKLVDNQKAMLMNDLRGSFDELAEAQRRPTSELEKMNLANQFNPAQQNQAVARQMSGSRFAQAVAKADKDPNPVAAYRTIVTTMILEPAFQKANDRWHENSDRIIARLDRVSSNLSSDELLSSLKEQMIGIDTVVQSHKFSMPDGDWWMTVQGKEEILQADLEKVTKTLENAIAPLAKSNQQLKMVIKDQLNELETAQKNKQNLVEQAVSHLKMVEASLNVAAIDGVQAIYYFPALLAIALTILTIDICRSLQELDCCRSKVSSERQCELTEWLTIIIHPSNKLHLIVAAWVVIASVHIRPLLPNTATFAGQLALALLVVGFVARWERLVQRHIITPVTAKSNLPND